MCPSCFLTARRISAEPESSTSRIARDSASPPTIAANMKTARSCPCSAPTASRLSPASATKRSTPPRKAVCTSAGWREISDTSAAAGQPCSGWSRCSVERYLSTEHRDHPEQGCPAAALVSEISRQPAEVQTAFRGGVDRFVALAGESLEAVGAEHGHDRAVFMFAAMVGGLALSRAIRDVDDSGSADILRAVKKQLGHMVNS